MLSATDQSEEEHFFCVGGGLGLSETIKRLCIQMFSNQNILYPSDSYLEIAGF